MSACARVCEKFDLPPTCCTSCHAYDDYSGDGLLCVVEVSEGVELEVCCAVAVAAREKRATPIEGKPSPGEG